MTLYGMLDYGQGFDPLLGAKLTPLFLSVKGFGHSSNRIFLKFKVQECVIDLGTIP